MNKLDKAWMAGIFEGEGSIGIRKQTKRNWTSLVVLITSTDMELLEPFHKEFGGSIKWYKMKGNRKQAYCWSIWSRSANSFLELLIPYFRVPRIIKKAELAIRFQGQKLNANEFRNDPEKRRIYHETQMEYYETMKTLNKRGKIDALKEVDDDE